MTRIEEPEGGRQPGEFGESGVLGDDDERGTETGSTTGTYTDAGTEDVQPGQGDAEAGS